MPRADSIPNRPSLYNVWIGLRRQLANPGRPVGERGARARPMRCSTASAQQVVAASSDEEWPAPGGVIAGLGDVLTGDPDRVAVHSGRAVVAPAGARRAANLRLVASES